MKNVFEISEVAHIWANQSQNEGRNSGSNFYFNGATIYSYNSSFPIATINGDDVLFTMRTYSQTTARHISIAKRSFIQLNGCMEGTCDKISVPVMDYTITETTKDYIKAGCHTIPKEDVRYIANLLKW